MNFPCANVILPLIIYQVKTKVQDHSEHNVVKRFSYIIFKEFV